MAYSSIPFELQYFVETDRNNRYEWLVFGITLISFILHGILFHWIPGYLRTKRDASGLKYRRYFRFLRFWELWTRCVGVKLPFRQEKVYFQPSVAVLGMAHMAIAGVFCFVNTIDLNYLPRRYVVAKRISRVAMGNLPMLFILIMKNDVLTSISGLQHDRLTFVHLWIGRHIFVLITIHLYICIKYWLDLNFPVMLVIPPQIFGMIAYGCLFMLTWASNRWMRRWAYDVFLVQHRVFAFIMLLLAYFHNPGNHKVVLIAVHLLVVDRVVTRIVTFLHRRKSPTKGWCEFEILDEDTLLITIPVKKTRFAVDTWYTRILPTFSTWKAGQHVYLNVAKVSFFQFHPFTISSVCETGEIKILMRIQNGFTKKLYAKLVKMRDEPAVSGDTESTTETTTEDSSISTQYTQTSSHHDEENSISMESTITTEKSPNAIKLKAAFAGPYGSKHQPLLPFDSCLFFGAGSGAAYTLPVALDLLNEIKRKDDEEDYLFRPANAMVHIVWVIRRRENEQWFKHALDPLKQHISEGRARLSIYITQENCSDKFEISTQESSSDNSMNKLINSEKVASQATSVHQLTNQYSESVESDGIERFYSRPNLGQLIEYHSTRLIDPSSSSYKSLAVCCCGPSDFTNVIKEQCQVNRKVKNSPDIYCYSETF